MPRTSWRVLVLTVVVLAGSVGCGAGEERNVRDAAGLTREDVAALSQEEEFALAAEHYVHVEELLRDAQLQISDEEWTWIGGDRVPYGGGAGGVGGPLAGSNHTNSYYLMASRLQVVPGGSGDEVGLEPMRRYFEEKGWQYYIRAMSGSHDIWGITGDGYRVAWEVRDNGRYSLDVYSELFWSNDSTELIIAIGGRDATDTPFTSRPGVFVPFPKWDDPFTRPPIMREPPARS
ncbi:hypothetical protein [Rathayibacter agropyri]|uniref:hypothetical protein n=1 Tax=Rathayibacter agropyri TaxID=1634927 RepID=UPI0015642787|nr:hypothetical protein [Rathayibacter agropyri]NRD09666.1 hypothetical protein [Rathayibacter agropyri]